MKKIMAQIEQVQLAPLMTARDLFARVPQLRSAAKALVTKVAAEAPAAPIKPAGHRVDVLLPGDRLLRHLEKACTQIDLPRDLRKSLSLGGFARGRTYRARGEVGGVPLPKVWRAVAQRDRDIAAAAARASALGNALTQIATAARNQGLKGADRLTTLVGDSSWVRRNAQRLIQHGGREIKGAQFLDDGRCLVIVELPSTALFLVLDAQGRVPGLPGDVRAALARSLKSITGLGQGTAKAPESADAADRPRVLRAKSVGKPARGATGARALAGAKQAARMGCQKELQDQLYRVPWDARRTVYDYVREREAAGDADVRHRLNVFLGSAREVQSRAEPGDQWYVEMELNLDGLDAALRG